MCVKSAAPRTKGSMSIDKTDAVDFSLCHHWIGSLSMTESYRCTTVCCWHVKIPPHYHNVLFRSRYVPRYCSLSPSWCNNTHFSMGQNSTLSPAVSTPLCFGLGILRCPSICMAQAQYSTARRGQVACGGTGLNKTDRFWSHVINQCRGITKRTRYNNLAL